MAGADTHAWWAELGSFYHYHQPGSPHPCRAGAGAFALRGEASQPQREWPLRVGVAMAGYEYVSSEQLAGFDKYKVSAGPAGTPVPPRPGLSQAAEERHGPCHLVPRGPGRAGGRFLRGSRGVLGLWGSACVGPTPLGSPPGLGTLPDRPRLRRPLDEGRTRESPSLLYFIIIIIIIF